MSSPTPFQLQVTIFGLCLFRPRPPNEMHVLMVKPKHHEPHYPRVWYDKAHETANATQPAGGPRVRKDLPKEIDWSQLAVTTGSVGELGSGLPDLSQVVGERPLTGGNINTLLKLPRGRATFTFKGPMWEWRGKHDPLAQDVTWHVTVNEASLPPTGQIPKLYPIAGVLELFMSNVIDADSVFPPPKGKLPEPGEPMAHFDAFYDLYEPPKVGDRPKPIFKPTRQSTSYSCLPSQGK